MLLNAARTTLIYVTYSDQRNKRHHPIFLRFLDKHFLKTSRLASQDIQPKLFSQGQLLVHATRLQHYTKPQQSDRLEIKQTTSPDQKTCNCRVQNVHSEMPH